MKKDKLLPTILLLALAVFIFGVYKVFHKVRPELDKVEDTIHQVSVEENPSQPLSQPSRADNVVIDKTKDYDGK